MVFTNGCFDILHVGHVTYLEQAASLGNRLVIGVNTDSSVKRLKGDVRPIVGETERAVLLAALDCTDAIVLFDEDTPLELLSVLKPDVLVKGGDYTIEQVVGREHVGEVKILPFVDGYSTTDVINRIVRYVKEGLL